MKWDSMGRGEGELTVGRLVFSIAKQRRPSLWLWVRQAKQFESTRESPLRFRGFTFGLGPIMVAVLRIA